MSVIRCYWYIGKKNFKAEEDQKFNLSSGWKKTSLPVYRTSYLLKLENRKKLRIRPKTLYNDSRVSESILNSIKFPYCKKRTPEWESLVPRNFNWRQLHLEKFAEQYSHTLGNITVFSLLVNCPPYFLNQKFCFLRQEHSLSFEALEALYRPATSLLKENLNLQKETFRMCWKLDPPQCYNLHNTTYCEQKEIQNWLHGIYGFYHVTAQKPLA